MIFKNIKRTYSTLVIDNFTFIKVLTEDKTVGYKDCQVYLKVNNAYKLLNYLELPKKYIDKLSTNHFKEMTPTELKFFKNSFINKENIIKEYNDIDDRVCCVLDTSFIVSRDDFYFSLKRVTLNEFNMIMSIPALNPAIIPYQMAYLLSKNKKYADNLFLVDDDTFVQVSKIDSRYLGTIFQIDNKGMATINGIFIIENNGEEYVIKTDIESEIAEANKVIEEECDKFKKRFENLK